MIPQRTAAMAVLLLACLVGCGPGSNEKPPTTATPPPAPPPTPALRAESMLQRATLMDPIPGGAAKLAEMNAQKVLAEEYARAGLTEKADAAYQKLIESCTAFLASDAERSAARAMKARADQSLAPVASSPDYYRRRVLPAVTEPGAAAQRSFDAGDFNAAAEKWREQIAAIEKLKPQLDAVLRRHQAIAESYLPFSAEGRRITREFKFDDELAAVPLLDWSGSWSFTPDGARLDRQADSFLRMREQLTGDFEIKFAFWIGDAAFSNTGGTYVHICGEGFVVTEAWQAMDATVRVTRKGDDLTFSINGQEHRRKIRPEHAGKPARFEIKWRSRATHVKQFRYTADGLEAPQGFAPGK